MTEKGIYKYVISSWLLRAKIDKLRLVKETAQFVTVLDRFSCEDRFKKKGRAFDTWEEAHQELLRRSQLAVANAECRLEYYRRVAAEIQTMRPEDGSSND